MYQVSFKKRCLVVDSGLEIVYSWHKSHKKSFLTLASNYRTKTIFSRRFGNLGYAETERLTHTSWYQRNRCKCTVSIWHSGVAIIINELFATTTFHLFQYIFPQISY
ncbi:hypothetical protein BS78_03G364800 [Paspalum vaginatum]|nr:hypothetical protein BS78_03G364800 [Paspalum vaginatum]